MVPTLQHRRRCSFVGGLRTMRPSEHSRTTSCPKATDSLPHDSSIPTPPKANTFFYSTSTTPVAARSSVAPAPSGTCTSSHPTVVRIRIRASDLVSSSLTPSPSRSRSIPSTSSPRPSRSRTPSSTVRSHRPWRRSTVTQRNRCGNRHSRSLIRPSTRWPDSPARWRSETITSTGATAQPTECSTTPPPTTTTRSSSTLPMSSTSTTVGGPTTSTLSWSTSCTTTTRSNMWCLRSSISHPSSSTSPPNGVENCSDSSPTATKKA